jgi:alcohol dehydrogenase class IV
MRFEFATAAQVVFGPGALQEVGKAAAGLGTKALVAAGHSGPDLERLGRLLEAGGVAWELFEVSGEPSVESVQAAVRAARVAGCDLLIGFGGGSAIDTAKAAAALLTNPGEPLDYLEVVGRGQALRERPAPFIAISTTAGTGSEVTRNAVLAVPEQQVKVSLRSPHMLARLALVDPELTLGLPPAITASTGMDALAQVIEPYVSKRANPFTDLYCREGIARAARALLHAYRNGQDREAREDMAFASLMGGLALANSGLGAVHGFAGPVGGLFDAPHGAVCACLLPPVVLVNARALAEREPGSPALARYAEIARWVTGRLDATVADLSVWLEELREALRIPTLKEYGVRAGDLDGLVEKSAVASSMKANPLPLTTAEMREILERGLN